MRPVSPDVYDLVCPLGTEEVGLKSPELRGVWVVSGGVTSRSGPVASFSISAGR